MEPLDIQDVQKQLIRCQHALDQARQLGWDTDLIREFEEATGTFMKARSCAGTSTRLSNNRRLSKAIRNWTNLKRHPPLPPTACSP